jgi:hypothetical protein
MWCLTPSRLLCWFQECLLDWRFTKVEWTEAKAAFERNYWLDLIAKTGGRVSEIVRLSGQNRTSIPKIMKRNEIAWPVCTCPTHRTGNWAQHGL